MVVFGCLCFSLCCLFKVVKLWKWLFLNTITVIFIYIKKKKKTSHSWMCLMCFDSLMMLAKGLNQSSFAKLEIWYFYYAWGSWIFISPRTQIKQKLNYLWLPHINKTTNWQLFIEVFCGVVEFIYKCSISIVYYIQL